MNVGYISIQNLKSKPLTTFLSVFVLALSIALLLGIQQLKSSFSHQLENNLGDIDVVVGAKGSPIQLVLSSVLHLDNPTGNISYPEALKIGKYPFVESAIPISYGDNYKGYRIVGTTASFTKLYQASLESGQYAKSSFEVVLGNTVAQALDLKIGDHILSSHGLVANDSDVHDDVLTVVGILKPTQKVVDRLLLATLETVWDVHDHEEEEEHHEEEHEEESHLHEHHEEEKEITALLIQFKSPRALLTFPRKINKKTNFQAVLPKYELDKLYAYTSIGFQTVSWIAYLILLISCVIIGTNLFKMVQERSYDLAMLRIYGASPIQLIKLVAFEAIWILCMAFVLGYGFVALGFQIAFSIVSDSLQQIGLQPLSLQEVLKLVFLIVVLVLITIGFAIYPILKMNISKILSHEK